MTPLDDRVWLHWRPLRGDDETGPVPQWQSTTPRHEVTEPMSRDVAVDIMRGGLPSDPRLYLMRSVTKHPGALNHVLWVVEDGRARVVLTDERRWKARGRVANIVEKYPTGGAVLSVLETHTQCDEYMLVAAMLMERDHRRVFFDACERLARETGVVAVRDATRRAGESWNAENIAAIGDALAFSVPAGGMWVREHFTPDTVLRHAHAVEAGTLLGSDAKDAVPEGW